MIEPTNDDLDCDLCGGSGHKDDVWNPIETAPKDGTLILLHGYLVPPCCERGPTTVIASWIDHNGGGWTWYGALGSKWTHWTNLPKGPNDEIENQG